MTGKGHIHQLEAIHFLYNFNLGLLIYIILLSILAAPSPLPKPVFYILTGIQLEENTEVLSFLPVLKQKQNTGFVSHYMFREQKKMQKKTMDTLRPLQWLTEQTLGGRKGSAARPWCAAAWLSPWHSASPRATSPSLLLGSVPGLRSDPGRKLQRGHTPT